MLDQVGAKAALADAQQKAQQFLDADVALMKSRWERGCNASIVWRLLARAGWAG